MILRVNEKIRCRLYFLSRIDAYAEWAESEIRHLTITPVAPRRL